MIGDLLYPFTRAFWRAWYRLDDAVAAFKARRRS